eukprot:COSAG02_NODE_3037_length_7501_cov_5.769116_3_plen_72_part_00
MLECRAISVFHVYTQRHCVLRASRERRRSSCLLQGDLGVVVVHKSGRGKGCLQRELTLLQEPDLACRLNTR